MGTIPPAVFILFFGLAAMAAGVLLSWLVFSMRGGGESHPPEARPEVADEHPVPVQAEGEELLSVRRVDGEVAVFVGSRRYRRLDDVRDRQQGEMAVAAIKAVLLFAEDWLPLRRRAPEPPRPAPPDKAAAFIEQLEGAGGPPPPEFKPPAEAIDDLIQRRLRKWPDLVSEKVRMSTAADGSLRIHVGLQVFQRVDDVPDPRVRALIKDAIREWEQR